MSKRIVFLILTTLLSISAFAVPPAPGISAARMPKDSVHKNADISSLLAKNAPAREIAKIIGTTGTKKIAVIFAYTTDKSFVASDISNYETPGTGYFARMNAYYAEDSYGLLNLTFTFYDNGGTGYALPNNSYYYAKNNYRNVVNGTLFNDACTAAVVTKSLGPFDALIVIHAGKGAESTGSMFDIWSMFVDWDTAGANGFHEGETVPATEASAKPFGTLCHEFGHQLGAVDLYDTTYGTSIVGGWELMDYGGWANNGDGPPHHCAWHKILFGWMTPVMATASTFLTLQNFEALAGNAYKIPISGSATEYFLVEFRKQTGMDTYLPGAGMLVWHIDDKIGNIVDNDVNSVSPHRRIILVTADNNSQMDSNEGLPGDAYKDGGIFTSPQSNGYYGPSFVTISDITGMATTTLTAQMAIVPVVTSLGFLKSVLYPNPVKTSATATIRGIFAKQFDSAALKIYTAGGELVFEGQLTTSNFQSSISLTDQLIYDYVWDLKDSSGSRVANGIYFCVIAAQIQGRTEKRIGKLAVIR